jgi:hypothetical protein
VNARVWLRLALGSAVVVSMVYVAHPLFSTLLFWDLQEETLRARIIAVAGLYEALSLVMLDRLVRRWRTPVLIGLVLGLAVLLGVMEGLRSQMIPYRLRIL